MCENSGREGNGRRGEGGVSTGSGIPTVVGEIEKKVATLCRLFH